MDPDQTAPLYTKIGLKSLLDADFLGVLKVKAILLKHKDKPFISNIDITRNLLSNVCTYPKTFNCTFG